MRARVTYSGRLFRFDLGDWSVPWSVSLSRGRSFCWPDIIVDAVDAPTATCRSPRDRQPLRRADGASGSSFVLAIHLLPAIKLT